MKWFVLSEDFLSINIPVEQKYVIPILYIVLLIVRSQNTMKKVSYKHTNNKRYTLCRIIWYFNLLPVVKVLSVS